MKDCFQIILTPKTFLWSSWSVVYIFGSCRKRLEAGKKKKGICPQVEFVGNKKMKYL